MGGTISQKGSSAAIILHVELLAIIWTLVVSFANTKNKPTFSMKTVQSLILEPLMRPAALILPPMTQIFLQNTFCRYK